MSYRYALNMPALLLMMMAAVAAVGIRRPMARSKFQ